MRTGVLHSAENNIIAISHKAKENLLVISYKKPPEVVALEEEKKKERLEAAKSASDGDVDCKQS